MKKKLLILGASILQVPAIKRAKERGLFVIVADMDKHAAGVIYADKFYNVSTLDYEKIEGIIKENIVDGILTIASDRPMAVIGKITEKFNLNGIDFQTAMNTTDKGIMRNTLEKKGIPIPKYKVFSALSEPFEYIIETGLPLIVKPTNNSGSRGIILLERGMSEVEIREAIKYSQSNSSDGSIIIEEFMEGPEVSVESITINDDCQIIAITDKITTGSPYFVEMGHSQPSQLPSNILDSIKELTINATLSLGIKNSVAHSEVIITEEGPKIVEIGSRLGGDYISTHLTPLSTGVDMIDLSIDLALGNDIILSDTQNKASVIKYINSKPGIVIDIHGIDEASKMLGIEKVFVEKEIGDTINLVKNSNDRTGFVIASGESIEEANTRCDEALSKISINVL